MPGSIGPPGIILLPLCRVPSVYTVDKSCPQNTFGPDIDGTECVGLCPHLTYTGRRFSS